MHHHSSTPQKYSPERQRIILARYVRKLETNEGLGRCVYMDTQTLEVMVMLINRKDGLSYPINRASINLLAWEGEKLERSHSESSRV